jgi:hypothetical protein
MEYIKKEFKKLGSIILILIGTFLIVEHIYTHGGIDLWDLLGHETFGIIFLVCGLLTANRWGRLKMKDGLRYSYEKIKYVLNLNGGKNEKKRK